jgi:hypothetical protein
VQTGTTVKASIANVQAAPVAAGTANAIQYLNGSKVPTTSSNLTWNGNTVGLKAATVSSFGTFYPGIEGSGPAAFVVSAQTNSLQLSSGIYNNNSFQDLYSVAGQKAAKYLIDAPAGTHAWFVTNTAGAAIGNVATLIPAMDISAVGNVTVSAGNLVIGTSGKGIDFSATSGTGTSELLADYEEGTWTPTLTFTSGSITYVTQLGTYTKIGNSVTLNFWIRVNTVSTPLGAISVASLPFNSGATGTRAAAALRVNNFAITGYCVAWVATSANTALLNDIQLGNAVTIDGVKLIGNTEIGGSFTYLVA